MTQQAPTAARPAVPQLFDADDHGIVFCIAPGPSLLYADLAYIDALATAHSHVSTITINDAYRPYAHAHFRFASDGYWWSERADAYHPGRYAGGCYCLEHGGPPRVQRLDYSSSAVLSDDPTILATGGHSGYSGINFAYLLGARTIALVGYDMQPSQAGPTAGQHHFGGDEPGQRHLRYHLWIPRYAALTQALAQRGVSLINCTRATAISESDVPRAALESIL